jgi:serine/threonine protein phosphatase PrpC
MIRFHAETHAGKVRSQNEDAMFTDGANGVFVVADGVGGRAAGEVASALTAETVERLVPAIRAHLDAYAENPDWEHRNAMLAALESVCQDASKTVYEEAERLSKRGMTTTVVMMAVHSGTAFFAHVGDSRAYLIRDGLIQQLTEDHSMVNELIRTGQMTPAEAETSKYRNVITRAVGLHPNVQVDVMSIDILPGDRVLLCSDGMSDPVSSEQLESLGCKDSVQTAAGNLLNAALDAGAPDNVTVVIVDPDATPQAEAARARAQIMETLFLFSDLPFHARLRVARICEARTIEPHEIIAEQDEPGNAMYIMVQGQVDVTRNGKILAQLGTGQHFGEMSLLDEKPRSATVTVTSTRPGSVMIIRREALMELCKREPGLGNKVLMSLATSLARRLRNTNEAVPS